MRTYRRITYEDRCQLYALRKAGTSERRENAAWKKARLVALGLSG